MFIVAGKNTWPMAINDSLALVAKTFCMLEKKITEDRFLVEIVMQQ